MIKFINIEKYLSGESGTTLVELMVAIVISAIIMIGGLQFFYGGKLFLNHGKDRRIALAIAEQRMETVLRYPYNQVADSLSEAGMVIGGKWTKTTTVSGVDDDTDGLGIGDSDGNINDYLEIAVTVDWGESSSKSILIKNYISEYGRQ
ncbi:MAG: prepilin-type N-terminal cleavage/methylation domain-containing protein [bacterium]